jgi:TonB family protein
MTKSSKQLPFALVIIWLWVGMLPLCAAGQNVPHRLSKDDVVKLLKGQVSPHRVGQRAREQGIDFQITPEVERELRQAGATDDLIATLRQIAPVLQPAQIFIRTSPRAQVYLDDAFKGQASPEGRLVIENPQPGDHSLRISLAGKKDYEQQLTVIAGQSFDLQATPPDLAGSIHIQTSPGAEVFLDDLTRGAADTGGGLFIAEVASGPHQLRVSAQGKKEFRQSINVVAGQESRIDASLADIEKPPANPDVHGVYRLGGEVSYPVAIYHPEPPYSEEARKKKHQGTVGLQIVIGADGSVTDAVVVKPLGYGLDENAVKTVRTWKFKPAMRQGVPVPVRVFVEVTFKLF